MPIRPDAPADRQLPARRLLIFSKIPIPGGSKTRLVPPLSGEEASDLARAFLLDALATLSALPGIDPWLYLTISWGDRRRLEESLPELFRSPLKERVTFRMQSGADLGERLEAAFDDAFADGCSAVCAVGSDHPTLPVSRIVAAFDALASSDLVLGPAEDGGYYLIGTRGHRPDLFLGLPYSTADLLDAVVAVASRESISFTTLEPWYDVDDPVSFERLRSERGSLPEGSHTRKLLEELESRMEIGASEARGNR